jgi:PAT family beta-lactamase induction signal transducer AmpG
VVTTAAAPEPAAARPPRTLGDAVIDPFAEYFRRPGAARALALVALYRAGSAVAASLLLPFLLDLGFRNAEVGLVHKGFGVAAMIAGTLVAGATVGRLGARRALLGFGALQALAIGGYLGLALVGRSHALLVVAVAVDYFCVGLGTTALDAWLISLCDPRHSATQYALFTSASGVAGRLLGAGAGFVARAVGWPAFFVGTIALALPGLALAAQLTDEAASPRARDAVEG